MTPEEICNQTECTGCSACMNVCTHNAITMTGDERDSSIHSLITRNPWIWDRKREELIRSMLRTFSRFQVVITDRYNGTIFSQIVNTPVVVLSSADHKLSSGVKWFPKEEFGKNIFFAANLEEAYKLADEILRRKGKIYKNPSYFKQK